jgi:hypothetical protein
MTAIDRMLGMDTRYLDRHVYTLANLVCAASRFEEPERALEYGELLRRLDYSRFLVLYRDGATKSLWHNKKFESMFEMEPDDERTAEANYEPDTDES